MRPVYLSMLAAVVVAAPVGLADSVSDDDPLADGLAEQGAHPCERVDLTELRHDPDIGDGWWDLRLHLRALDEKCRTQGPDSGSFVYTVTYVADSGEHEDVDYGIDLDLQWKDGELGWTHLWVSAHRQDGSWWTVGMSGVGSIVDEANGTVDLPAPGEVPFRDLVVASHQDTEGITSGTASTRLPADRMPNTGSATLGE